MFRIGGGRIALSRAHNMAQPTLSASSTNTSARKLRGCDLIALKVSDLQTGDEIRPRAKVIQSKTRKPVQFEVMLPSCDAVTNWINALWLVVSKLEK